MGKDVQFSEGDWERTRRDWSAWWAGELERPLVWIESFEPPAGSELPEVYGFTTGFTEEMSAGEIVDRWAAHIACVQFYGDAVPKWWPNYGPGIMAGFIGARVRSTPDTVWFEPARQVSPSEMKFSYDADNPWWRRIREVTRAAVERWEGQLCVAHTDIGGNLDILASMLTTNELLLDLCDCPEEIERLMGEITSLWLRYYQELAEIIEPAGRGTTPWANIWSPGRCYMLQSDFAYMISTPMFERFVMPDLEACCRMLEHPFYHLDGVGQIPHLDLLLELDELRGIQWIPGTGHPEADGWPDLLRRVRDAGKLLQLYVSPEGARTIVRELGGKGFMLAITQQMERAEAEDLIATLTA